jgi:hypothetical protein
MNFAAPTKKAAEVRGPFDFVDQLTLSSDFVCDVPHLRGESDNEFVKS